MSGRRRRAQVAAARVEAVEDDEDGRRGILADHSPLQELEARDAAPVEDDDLAVEDQRGRRQRSGADYLAAIQGLQMISRAFAMFMQAWEVVLTPVVADPSPPLGTFDATPDNPLAGFMRAAEYVPFTPLANVTGQPAMSVPLSWNAPGLPVGAHFVGRFGDEATLFRLAAQLEAARPWARRVPALAACVAGIRPAILDDPGCWEDVNDEACGQRDRSVGVGDRRLRHVGPVSHGDRNAVRDGGARPDGGPAVSGYGGLPAGREGSEPARNRDCQGRRCRRRWRGARRGGGGCGHRRRDGR